MMQIKAGTVDVSVVIRIVDSTDGTPETGVAAATGGLVLEYRRELAASVSLATIVDLAALTTAHTDKGIKHIGNGYYRLDLVDAACAAGVTGVLVHGTATGMVVIGQYIQLVAYDPFDTVRLGLTALPNAAADAAGGLPISDAGGLDLDALNTAAVRLTAARAQIIDDWVNGGRLDLILDIIAADVAGLDGAAMRGTDSAALASVCTEARLAELAAANLPADVDTLLSRLSAARALLLDEITAVRMATLTDWINGGRLDLLLDAIKAVTDAIGATGAGLSAIPWNAAWDAEVQSEATDALNAYDPPTRTEATADKDEILTQLPAAPVKNAAFTYVVKMVDSTDHVTPKTGLTVTMTRSIDGAAFGAATGTVTEISTGHYKVAASAADMNGDVVTHRFTGTGADDLTVVFKTVS